MEDILSEYTAYVMLLKETSLHQFKHTSSNPRSQSIDKDIIDGLVLLKENYAAIKEAFYKMLKESEPKDDKFESEFIKWLSNNIFSDGYILTKDYFFAMLKFFQVDEDGYYFNDTCYHILCKIDGLVSDYETVYYDVLRKIKTKVEELKKLIID